MTAVRIGHGPGVLADEVTVGIDPASIEDPALDAALDDVFGEVVPALRAAEIGFVLMGGIGSRVLGRNRWTHDIDLFVTERGANAALPLLAGLGYETERTYWDWLFKAEKRGITVDLIFRSAGGIRVDDELLERATLREVHGVETPVIPPEDLIVIKAVVHDEHLPRHWYDGLGVLAKADLDWDYLLRRARTYGARRTLSMLVYAQANDLCVPNRAIEALFDDIYRS